MAGFSLSVQNRRITARAVIDARASCGVIPASSWKTSYMCENNAQKSLQSISWYQVLWKVIEISQNKNLYFNRPEHHRGMVWLHIHTALWC